MATTMTMIPAVPSLTSLTFTDHLAPVEYGTDKIPLQASSKHTTVTPARQLRQQPTVALKA